MLALVLLCAFAAAFAIGADKKSASAISVDDNYYFEHVDVHIDVRKDKTFAIKETLYTRFRESNVNTGIIRDIQRISRTTHTVSGGQKQGSKFIAGLSDVSVLLDGGEAKVTRSLYHDGEFHSIKMQTPSGYIQEGTHVFELSYIYDMGDDKVSGYDDFTFDVLGYAMNATHKFTAKITFPEDADLSRVTMRTNEKRPWTPDKAEGEGFEIDGNTVSVTAFPYRSNKGYTVQVLLPEGYFKVHKTVFWQYFLFLGASLLAIGVCVALFLISVLNRKPSPEVIEYLPPEELDIMHASAAWHRGARYKDISALLLKWAGDGLLDMQKDGERDLKIKLSKKMRDEETREVELKKMSAAERSYFKFLFCAGKKPKTFSTRTFKSQSQTYKKSVYERCEKLVESGDDPKPHKLKATTFAKIIGLIGLIPSVMVNLYFGMLNDSYLIALFVVVFWAAGVFAGLQFYSLRVIILLVIPFIFYAVLYCGLLWFMAFPKYDYAGLFVIAPLWELLCIYLAPYYLKNFRSKEVEGSYARLHGFKKFLLLTELPQIQLLFDEHPDYFTKIMPYCYVMGISKKVIKRFAALDFARPPYIENGVDEDILDHAMPNRGPVIVSSYGGGDGGSSSSSSGGGSSGSSGGGGGGGGSRGC